MTQLTISIAHQSVISQTCPSVADQRSQSGRILRWLG